MSVCESVCVRMCVCALAYLCVSGCHKRRRVKRDNSDKKLESREDL